MLAPRTTKVIMTMRLIVVFPDRRRRERRRRGPSSSLSSSTVVVVAVPRCRRRRRPSLSSTSSSDDDVSYNSPMLPEPRAYLPWDTPRATAATSATSTTSTTSDDDDDDDGDEEIGIAALQLRRPRQKPFCPSASRSMWGCRHQELRWLGGARASEATQSAPEELARLRVRFVSSTFLL